MKSFAELLPHYLQTVAIIAGALWAYRKFLHQREDEPATDVDVFIQFVGTQDSQRIVEVTAIIDNKSLVRHRYKDFRVTVRYLLAGDPVTDGGAQLHYQLSCPTTIDARIDGEKRFFANVSYINPRQRFQHRYVTFVPLGATFVWAQCRFTFQFTGLAFNIRRLFTRRQGEVFTNAQRIVPVPPVEERQEHGALTSGSTVS